MQHFVGNGNIMIVISVCTILIKTFPLQILGKNNFVQKINKYHIAKLSIINLYKFKIYFTLIS